MWSAARASPLPSPLPLEVCLSFGTIHRLREKLTGEASKCRRLRKSRNHSIGLPTTSFEVFLSVKNLLGI